MDGSKRHGQVEADIIPVLPNLEISTLPISLPAISPAAFETLAEKDPSGLLGFIESYDKRRFELMKLEAEQRHKEKLSEEEIKLEADKVTTNTNRIGMILVFAFLVCVLLYSGLFLFLT